MARPIDPFTEHVIELMPVPDAVMARRMFGGIGLFRDGTMFGIIDEGRLFFKTDSDNRAEFESKGLPPLTFRKKDGSSVTLSYHQYPEEALQRQDTMSPWAESAINASLRQRK